MLVILLRRSYYIIRKLFYNLSKISGIEKIIDLSELINIISEYLECDDSELNFDNVLNLKK